MKYRFTPEHFEKCDLEEVSVCDVASEIANALLEQWEKESEKVYSYGNESDLWDPVYRDRHLDAYTHTAILWNPRKIREGGETE